MKKIITIIITLLALAGVAYVYVTSQKQPEENMVACTMDAKMCPDGSYVGRQGPNCEFSACPGAGAEVNIKLQ